MTDPTEPHSLRAVMEQLAAAEAERALGDTPLSARERRARTVARLAAVQAL